MKKGLLFPLSLIAAILAFCIWNGVTMQIHTDRWHSQLQKADALAQSEDWAGTLAALASSYADWTAHQTYLHIVAEHGAIDDAEAMFHRAIAFAATKESSEFQAELSDLQDQLRLLSEMEEFSVRNIL